MTSVTVVGYVKQKIWESAGNIQKLFIVVTVPRLKKGELEGWEDAAVCCFGTMANEFDNKVQVRQLWQFHAKLVTRVTADGAKTFTDAQIINGYHWTPMA